MKKKAIFLDRDGVLNKGTGIPHTYITSLRDFVLLPGVKEAIKTIKEQGYLAIVITNQAGLGKGLIPPEEYEKINSLLKSIGIDAIYTCGHDYTKEECECRKPKPGLILKAAEDHNIDLANSWMIGDNQSDVDAGSAAGCKTYLLKNESLSSALKTILDGSLF